jgi:hypothetical protein
MRSFTPIALPIFAAITCTALISGPTTAEAKNIDLPPNVTLRPGNMSGSYIDTVSQEARGASFSKLKLCLAQNVSNSPVTITGGTDTAFTFYSSHRTQTSTIQGGDLFKYEDADAAMVIAIGSTDGGTSMMGLMHEVIGFELMAIATPERTMLKFSNIARTTLNTGSVTNEGFLPVGAWKGAKPLAVIGTLQSLGDRIDSCLR